MKHQLRTETHSPARCLQPLFLPQREDFYIHQEKPGEGYQTASKRKDCTSNQSRWIVGKLYMVFSLHSQSICHSSLFHANIYFNIPSSQGYGFSGGHVWMWELDYKESWVLKNWRFWTVVLEKTLESPLDCKEIQQVHPKGDQSWVFFGRNDAKAETPVLWPPHAKSWLIGKDSDSVRDWGQEEKGTTEDEMAGWHHWLNGRESEWTPGVGDGQGGLACCDSWGGKESETTATELNWTELKHLDLSG